MSRAKKGSKWFKEDKEARLLILPVTRRQKRIQLVVKQTQESAARASEASRSMAALRAELDNAEAEDSCSKAAALVDLANDERGIPEEIIDSQNLRRASEFYVFFGRFEYIYIWKIFYIALISLNFLEKPLWCSRGLKVSCSDRKHYYLGEIPYLTSAVSLAYEGVTFIILVFHTVFPVSYEGWSIYRSHHANGLKVILLFVLVADLLVHNLCLYLVDHTLPIRIAPYLRVVFSVFYFRDLRDNFVVLVGMVGAYLKVLILCLFFLLFSSWLAYVLFEHTQEGTTKFVSYPATLCQLFVLFTTSNNPDVWVPAYESSRWYSLFFVPFVLLGVYFLTNLVLAVVYESFQSGLAKQVTKKDQEKAKLLRKAFDTLDVHRVGYIDKPQCKQLFQELQRYRTLPAISEQEFEIRFDELDKNGDSKIVAAEFNDLLDIIAIKLQKRESEPWLSKYDWYKSSSNELKGFVSSGALECLVILVLFLNLAVMIAETWVDIHNKSGHKSWQKVEFVFALIYLLEVFMRGYTYGFINYWNDRDNQYNIIFTCVIVIGEILTWVSSKKLKFISTEDWIRSLLIARILRLFRLLMHIPPYQDFVDTFLYLVPSLLPYLGTIFCVMCIYCTMGIQVFGGLVYVENPHLNHTDIADNKYFSFNFNDFPNGMVTLFNLIVMGSWQVWMEDYATLKGTFWTYMYFVSFYVITVLFLLNLIVSFVLQAFFAQIDLKLSEKRENTEGTRTLGRPRRVGTTSRQKINMLVHHMLSARLNRPQPASLKTD